MRRNNDVSLRRNRWLWSFDEWRRKRWGFQYQLWCQVCRERERERDAKMVDFVNDNRRRGFDVMVWNAWRTSLLFRRLQWRYMYFDWEISRISPDRINKKRFALVCFSPFSPNIREKRSKGLWLLQKWMNQRQSYQDEKQMHEQITKAKMNREHQFSFRPNNIMNKHPCSDNIQYYFLFL